jgi:putative flippase GtrA
MFRLGFTLFPIITTTTAGIGVLVALVTGNDTATPILIAAAAGFIAGFPITYWTTKAISEQG